MNSKGFTLIELLAVIVVLAIVGTLSIVIYSGFSDSIKEKEYETLINLYKSSIKVYVEDNDYDNVTIVLQELIDTDYVSAPADGIIINPINESYKLNCLKFNVIKENNEYIVSYDETSTNVLIEDKCN